MTKLATADTASKRAPKRQPRSARVERFAVTQATIVNVAREEIARTLRERFPDDREVDSWRDEWTKLALEVTDGIRVPEATVELWASQNAAADAEALYRAQRKAEYERKSGRPLPESSEVAVLGPRAFFRATRVGDEPRGDWTILQRVVLAFCSNTPRFFWTRSPTNRDLALVAIVLGYRSDAWDGKSASEAIEIVVQAVAATRRKLVPGDDVLVPADERKGLSAERVAALITERRAKSVYMPPKAPPGRPRKPK